MPNWKKVITSGSDASLNSLNLSGVVNANTDTDKFLVLDGTGNVDFRTGTQTLSDINPGGLVSGSSQITISSTTGYTTFSSSIAADIAQLESTSNPTLQDVTDNGSTTTNGVNIIGTVGVGTDNPTYQLHVSSSTSALGVYERAGGASLYLEGQLNRAVLGTVSTHPLLFAVNSAEVSRIDTAGVYQGAVSGSVTATSLILKNTVNAGTDTDKFLVLDSSNNVDFRTGAQVLSDINPGGLVSSSAQVTISSTTGYTTFSSSIASDIADLNGAGYVDTSGTPSNNQLAIFTDSNTIEGVNNLTYDNTTFNVSGSKFVVDAKFDPSSAVSLGMGGNEYLTIDALNGLQTLGGFTSTGQIGVLAGPGQSFGANGLEINNAANANVDATIRLAASSSGASGANGYWTFGIKASDNSHDFVFTNHSSISGVGVPNPVFTISKATNQVKIGSLVVSGSGTFKNIGPAQFSGSIAIRTSDQVVASTDTDKFLVLDGQQIKYRSGTQILSDIDGVSTNTTQTITGAKTFSSNLKATSNAEFTGSVKLNTQTAATTDTDKFLVFDTGGQIKYRTGAQVLSDIGGQSSGNYVDISSTQTITGAKTFSSNTTFNGNVVVAGKITAQEFNTELVSSSIIFSSGSTKFGDSSDDKHDFTGSLSVNGGITIWNLNDPQLTFAGQGLASSIAMGIDDSDSDKFKISRSTALGTNDIYKYNYNGGSQNHTFAGDLVLTNSNVGFSGGQLVKINSSGFLVPAVANTDYVPTGSTPDIYVINPVQTYVDFKSQTIGALPFGGIVDLQPIDKWLGVWIAPTTGYIDKIYVSPENTNATQDALSIQMYVNGTTQGTAQSENMGAAGTNVSYTFGSTNYSFGANDRISLYLNKGNNDSDLYAFQVVFRVNN